MPAEFHVRELSYRGGWAKLGLERTGTVLTVVILLVLLNIRQQMREQAPIVKKDAHTMTISMPLAVHNDVARAKQAVRNLMLSAQRQQGAGLLFA